MGLNWTTGALGSAAIGWLLWSFRAGPWTAMHAAGLVLLLPAVVLLGVARAQLGGAFTVQARSEALVTTGLYSRIRNPIYVFGGLTLAGAALWAGRPQWLLLTLVWAPLQWARSRNEERVLRARFGEEYEAYRRGTWF